MAALDEMCDVELYPYQRIGARRVFFSLIIGDAEQLTFLLSRQSGKTEFLACTIVIAMIVLPKLAAIFPEDETLAKFKNGVMVGVFAPIEDQAETLFSRIALRFDSDKAKRFLADPEINEVVIPTKNLIKLKNSRSFCQMQTAHAKAKIESKTYHLIIIDEAQDADPGMVRKSINPMTTATAGTIIHTGTATSHKSDFYEAIQRNKRRGPTNGQKNHFEFDYKHAAKANKFYALSIENEKNRLGEDSDEFKMSYMLIWMLDRGMFVTDEQIDAMGDPTMPLIHSYTDSPIVIGIDVARKHDSTVCTAIWVDWDHPDEFGLYNHRILNWLEVHGENWESQYAQICDFVSHYRVMRIGVDAQGMGGPVAERLGVLLPHIEVVPLPSNPIDQTERWKHLMQLIQRQLLGWPAHSSAKQTMKWKRFVQQMADVEKEYRGNYVLVASPKNEKNAHDDYIDSLAIACYLTKEFEEDNEVIQWSNNPFLERGIGVR